MAVIEIVNTVHMMRGCSDLLRSQGKRIVFVPTMGYLHEGHLSLMRKGRRKGDCLVVSIFVNPTQFAPGEDLDTYPRDLDRDLKLLEKEGADFVFTPRESDLYPEGFQTYIELEKLPKHLCGVSRPTFFRGVATVVAKLFNIVQPHVAVFGQKDYQQLTVIGRLVRDLNLEIEIVGAPIVREPDGLAMSSRNKYLNSGQRAAALSLYQSLIKAKALLKSGTRDASKIIKEVSDLFLSQPETAIDYIAVCDPKTLERMDVIDRPALMALAVKVGSTRLIDNMILDP